jgi:hypothetical protein
MNKALAILGAVALVAANQAAQATEGGGSIYPVGSENFTCCALPPPGVYGMVYVQNYSADKVRGNDGQVVTPDTFKVKATAVAPRLVWVAPTPLAGADVGGLHAILPLVDLSVDVAPGTSQSKSGIGDIVFGPFLAWHHSASLHTVAGLDFFAPTGSYKKGDVANIGRNYWAVQTVLGASFINPQGFNADAKAMWTYNFQNGATDYKSGQELIVDYALGWGVGGGWTLGVGGYAYQQLTDDKSQGTTVRNNKGRALAVGPSVRYDSGKGWFLTAKYEAEQSVRNRAEGAAFWFKGVMAF